MLAALHDLNLAARWCDVVYVLDEGEIVASGPPRQALSAELSGPRLPCECYRLRSSHHRMPPVVVRPSDTRGAFGSSVPGKGMSQARSMREEDGQRVGTELIVGDQPEGVWTIQTLADPTQQEEYVGWLQAWDPSLIRRKAALTLVHYTLHTVKVVLMAPLLFDHLALDVTAEPRLGAVVDGSGQIAACWVGRVKRVDATEPIGHTGALMMRLLEPVVATAAGYGTDRSKRNHKCGPRLVALCLRNLHKRSLGLEPGEGIAQRLIAATGQADYRPGRLLGIQADHGPPVVLRVPHVLAACSPALPSSHACPTCPRHPDDETRIENASAWLVGLNDDSFCSVTGRPRCGWSGAPP